MANEVTEVPYKWTILAGGYRKASVDKFVGRKFWQADQFADPDFGLPNAGGLNEEVLVSGSGDGGLQDFIRLATGRSRALDVLNTLTGSGVALPNQLLVTLGEAEAEARRTLLWVANSRDEHRVLSKLHGVHLSVLSNWLPDHSPSWIAAQKALNLMMKYRGINRLKLFHRCTHFSACYPLNRFVVLLLARLVEAKTGVNPLIERTSVVAVRPPLSPPSTVGGARQFDHVCKLGCWGPIHEVDYENGVECEQINPPLAMTRLFRGTVIRHGLKNHTNAGLRRDVLPLHLDV